MRFPRTESGKQDTADMDRSWLRPYDQVKQPTSAPWCREVDTYAAVTNMALGSGRRYLGFARVPSNTLTPRSIVFAYPLTSGFLPLPVTTR